MNTTKTKNAIYIIGLLFFIFGFITWLNNTLIIYLRVVCQLKSDVESAFVTSAFYISYFIFSLPAAAVLKKTGFKRGMAYGLIVIGVGALLFIPAASMRSFPMFLFGLLVQGAGLSMLQAASNPYVTILGPLEAAGRRMSIMGICNKGAGALAPLILGLVLLNGFDSIQAQLKTASDPVTQNRLLSEIAGRVTTPYLVIGLALFVVSFLIYRSGLPDIEQEDPSDVVLKTDDNNSIFDYPHLLLGALCIFVYVGVEVMAGDAIAIYGKAEGMSISQTRFFGTFTLCAMLAGYLLGVIGIPKLFSQRTGLRVSALVAMVFAVCTYFTHGFMSILFIALLGLANALMWGGIWPLAMDGLGKHIKTGAAMLVMAIAGGGIFTPLYAKLKDYPQIGNKLAFLICLPCYLFIFYYSVSGYKLRRTKAVKALI